MTSLVTFRRTLLVLFLVSLLGTAASGFSQASGSQAATPAEEADLVVGPDLLVSRDGTFPHIEPTVAAHPRDPSNLVAAAMTLPRPVRGVACRIYTSLDGGSTWKTVELEEQVEKGLGDPQVAFTPRGTALFACLTQGVRASGRPRAALRVYRSEDGGLTWQGPAEAGTGSYDHPVIAVDHTVGAHAGNVYFGVLYSSARGEAVLGVLRSEDDGRHFTGPVEITRSAEDGLVIAGLGVLSDGTLAVSYTRTPRRSGGGGEPRESVFEMVTSEDGGVTFSEPRKIATRITRPRDRTDESLVARLNLAPPMWTVDGSETETRDRLYLVWSDWRTGAWRVLATASSDRGETWTEPREVDPDAPESAHQFLPVPVVSRDGVLGVAYFDSRGYPDLDGYHQRFTATVDGGASFLASRRISSEPSRPAEARANDRVVLLPIADRDGGVFHLAVLNAEGRWPMGGDYMGLTVDARGVFHPLWSDSRRGAFQLWTAAVRVERDSEGRGRDDSGGEDAEREPRPVTARVELISGPVEWDAERGEFRIPIRLQNVSDEPLHPPLTVEVVAVGWMRDVEDFPEEEREWVRQGIASILNADNGETGVGAVFDYTEALGDLEALEPGAVTGARIWHIRGRKHAQAPIRVEVRGVVAE